MSYIELKNVSAFYPIDKKDEIQVFKNLNLDFSKGSITAIMGPNGSGKSSFLKLFCELIDYEGDIFIDGKDIFKTSFKKKNISYVSQESSLNKYLNIFDNIAFPLKILHEESHEIIKKVVDIAKEFEIDVCLSRKPSHISLGQQKRAEIAKALVKKPSVCLLDEPFANIDPKLKENILPKLKKEFKENNTTVFYVTHNLKECLSIADNLIYLLDGKVIFQGKPEDVLKSTLSELDDIKKGLYEEK